MDGALLLPQTPKLGKPEEIYAGGTSRKDGVVLVYRGGLPSVGDTGISIVLKHGAVRLGNRLGAGAAQEVGWAEDEPFGVEMCSAEGTRPRGGCHESQMFYNCGEVP